MDVALHQLRRHLRARPVRGDRRRRRQPQRHVGHVDPAGRARDSGWPRRATSPGCASSSTRRSTSTTLRPWSASRRVRRRTTSRRSARPAAPTYSCATATRTCSIVAVGSMARGRRRRRRAADRPGHRRHGRRPALGQADRPGDRRAGRASTASWSASRTTGGSAAAVQCLLQTLNDAGVTTPFRLHGIPQEFLDHAKRDVDPGAGSASTHRAIARGHRGGRDGRRRRSSPARCRPPVPEPRVLRRSAVSAGLLLCPSRPASDAEPSCSDDPEPDTRPAVQARRHGARLMQQVCSISRADALRGDDKEAFLTTSRPRGARSSSTTSRSTSPTSSSSRRRVRLHDRPREPDPHRPAPTAPSSRSASSSTVTTRCRSCARDRLPVLPAARARRTG